MMGYLKHISTESKVFSISQNGNSVIITEKSWRVFKEVRLGMVSVQWFAKFLFDCLDGNVKEYYSTFREGSRSFIAQKCKNDNGSFMALVEYGGGRRRQFIFIPEDVRGQGWRWVAESLWEVLASGRKPRLGRGVAPISSGLTSHNRSFKEALVSAQPVRGRKEDGEGRRMKSNVLSGVGGGVPALAAGTDEGATATGQNQAKAVSGTATRQTTKGGGGSRNVCQEGSHFLGVLEEIQDDLRKLQDKLIICFKSAWSIMEGGSGLIPNQGMGVGDPKRVVGLEREVGCAIEGSSGLGEREGRGNVDHGPCRPVGRGFQRAVSSGPATRPVWRNKQARGLPSCLGPLPGISPSVGSVPGCSSVTQTAPTVLPVMSILPENTSEGPNLGLSEVEQSPVTGISSEDIQVPQILPMDSSEVGGGGSHDTFPPTDYVLPFIAPKLSEEVGGGGSEEIFAETAEALHLGSLQLSEVGRQLFETVVLPEGVLDRAVGPSLEVIPSELGGEVSSEEEDWEVDPIPLNRKFPNQYSDWVFSTVQEIQKLVGLNCVGFEDQFLALITAIEAARDQGKHLSSKKKYRELNRLSWSLNEVSASRDRGKGKGIAPSG